MKLRMAPSYQGDTVISIFPDLPELESGDILPLQYRNTDLGTLKVRKIEQRTLQTITLEDLRGSMYTTPQIFWSRLETELKTGLPAEFPVWVVTFGPEHTQDPVFAALEEIEEEVPVPVYGDEPKPKAKPKYKSHKTAKDSY